MTAAWMQADPNLEGVFEHLPSAKVETTAALEEHIHYRLQHLHITQAHFCSKQYRALRWRSFRKRQSAMSKMCSDLTGNRQDTIVGYGDAKFNSNGPTVSLRRRLRSLCCLYDVDEFRTSKLGCACHQPMTGMTSPAQGMTPFHTWPWSCLHNYVFGRIVLCTTVVVTIYSSYSCVLHFE